MDIPIPFICVFPVQVLSIVLVTYLYYKALLTMIMTPKGVASSTLFIYHIQKNCHLPSVLFGRQNTPIDFVHGISHAHELNYSTNKKNNIHQNISQVCHDSLRRRKLSLSVFYQVQVLLKYISSYNVSLIKRTIIYHWKRRQQYTHIRAVRTCFIFKCQYQVSMYTTMGRGTTLS